LCLKPGLCRKLAFVPSPTNVHNDREQHTEKYDFQRQHVDHDATNRSIKDSRSQPAKVPITWVRFSEALDGKEWPKSIDDVFIAARRVCRFYPYCANALRMPYPTIMTLMGTVKKFYSGRGRICYTLLH
jgi:hypothetical protein